VGTGFAYTDQRLVAACKKTNDYPRRVRGVLRIHVLQISFTIYENKAAIPCRPCG
jgi:hypothetical protein